MVGEYDELRKFDIESEDLLLNAQVKLAADFELLPDLRLKLGLLAALPFLHLFELLLQLLHSLLSELRPRLNSLCGVDLHGKVLGFVGVYHLRCLVLLLVDGDVQIGVLVVRLKGRDLVLEQLNDGLVVLFPEALKENTLMDVGTGALCE